MSAFLTRTVCSWDISPHPLIHGVSCRMLGQGQALVFLCLCCPWGWIFPWGSSGVPPRLLSLVLQPKSQQFSCQGSSPTGALLPVSPCNLHHCGQRWTLGPFLCLQSL